MPFQKGKSGNPKGRPRLTGAALDACLERRKARERARYYNLTPREVLKLKTWTIHCWCCGTDTPGPNNISWNIDHDHLDGEVRGLLCMHCNLFIGHASDGKGARDSLEALDKAYKNARSYLLNGRDLVKRILQS